MRTSVCQRGVGNRELPPGPALPRPNLRRSVSDLPGIQAIGGGGSDLPSSGRRVAEGQKLVKEIISAGGSALFARTDVARQDDIVALVEKTVGHFRRTAHCVQQNSGGDCQRRAAHESLRWHRKRQKAS